MDPGAQKKPMRVWIKELHSPTYIKQNSSIFRIVCREQDSNQENKVGNYFKIQVRDNGNIDQGWKGRGGDKQLVLTVVLQRQEDWSERGVGHPWNWVVQDLNPGILSLRGILRVFWALDHKDSWGPNNWYFQTVLKKTIESSLDSKEIKPVNPKRNQPWIFIGRTNAEVPYFGHLTWRVDSLEKTLKLGKTEGRKRRGWQRWDGWMESSSQWTWAWANSGRQWRTGKPGMLQSMGLQRVGYHLVTEQQHFWL